MPRDRTRSKALHAEHTRLGDALGWFDALYREAAGNPAAVPWADLAPNAHLVAWHARTSFNFTNRACLVVGCGLGDDAEYLAQAGGRVTAFDLSETAIHWCGRRVPDTRVDYRVANLLAPPAEWARHFDFVFEANTLQSLPAEVRGAATERVGGFVAPGGTLVVICRARDADEIVEGPPWPLRRDELDGLQRIGLRVKSFGEVVDAGDEPVRRFVGVYEC